MDESMNVVAVLIPLQLCELLTFFGQNWLAEVGGLLRDQPEDPNTLDWSQCQCVAVERY